MIRNNASMESSPRQTSSRRWTSVMTVVAALLAVSSACSDDDGGDTAVADTSSSTTEAPASTEAASTTAEAPATTQAAPTTATPTTEAGPTTAEAPATTQAASTTATPTTEAGPTTTVLLSEAAASAAVEELFDLWTECLEAMPDCDPMAVSTTAAMGALSDAMYVSASLWSEEGATFENLESRRIVVESASVDQDTGTSRVVTCTEDGAIRSGPDGSILNDDFISYRQEWELITDGTTWIGVNRTELERALGQGSGLCAEDE